MAQVILSDIPSKGEHPKCWSFNVWKTRIVLNYKEIPYETVWIEYPDIEPTHKSRGIPPGQDTTPYTCPVVQFTDDKTYLMESKKIGFELERRYASPSLRLDSPYVERLTQIIPKAIGPLRAELLHRTMVNVLPERSREYFDRTRAEWFGRPLPQVAAEEGGEVGWEKAQAGLQELAALLKENPEGPFFEGKKPCWADFVVVSIMQGCRMADEKYLFERLLSFDESFGEVYRACEKWLAKND